MGDAREGGRGQRALTHARGHTALLEDAQAESPPMPPTKLRGYRPLSSTTVGRIAELVGASIARGGVQTGRAAVAVAECLRETTSAILSLASWESIPAGKQSLYKEPPKQRGNNKPATIEPKEAVSNKFSLKRYTKSVDTTSIYNQLSNANLQNQRDRIRLHMEKVEKESTTKFETPKNDSTESIPQREVKVKKRISQNSGNNKGQSVPKSKTSKINAANSSAKLATYQNEVCADEPDEMRNGFEEKTPQLSPQRVPSTEQHPNIEKKVMYKIVSKGKGDVSPLITRYDYAVEDTKDVSAKTTTNIASKLPEGRTRKSEKAGTGSRRLVALSSSISSEDNNGNEFTRSDSCDCVEELRKYVNPPRVFIPDLQDYGEDQDQFIARRDCSKMSKRYLRCADFWVSTCSPPGGQPPPPPEAAEQWEKTCPPPPRRSLQECIRAKEAAHEEERKRILVESRKKRPKDEPQQHLPTAPPRLCRSIYDECEPPLGPPPE